MAEMMRRSRLRATWAERSCSKASAALMVPPSRLLHEGIHHARAARHLKVGQVGLDHLRRATKSRNFTMRLELVVVLLTFTEPIRPKSPA